VYPLSENQIVYEMHRHGANLLTAMSMCNHDFNFNAQKTKQFIYNISGDCGRSCISKTSRHLEVHIKVHKYNLTQGLLEKSKLAQHAYEEGHRIFLKEAKVVRIEPYTTYRKYKESTHMSLVDHPISQPNLDISLIWTPVITAEV
jgi:hypothetical protein